MTPSRIFCPATSRRSPPPPKGLRGGIHPAVRGVRGVRARAGGPRARERAGREPCGDGGGVLGRQAGGKRICGRVACLSVFYLSPCCLRATHTPPVCVSCSLSGAIGRKGCCSFLYRGLPKLPIPPHGAVDFVFAARCFRPLKSVILHLSCVLLHPTPPPSIRMRMTNFCFILVVKRSLGPGYRSVPA